MLDNTNRSDADGVETPLPGRAVVVFVALLSAGVVFTLGVGAQTQDYATPFALPLAYRMLVGCQAFAMLVLVPAAAPGAPWITFVLLSVLAAPAAVLTGWASDCDLSALLTSQVYVALLGALVVGWQRHDPEAERSGVWWLLVGGFGAACPFVAFVVGDALRLDVDWLYALSPFWVADRLSQSWHIEMQTMLPAGVLLAATALAFLWPAPRRAE